MKVEKIKGIWGGHIFFKNKKKFKEGVCFMFSAQKVSLDFQV